jgi:hypothetical protein
MLFQSAFAERRSRRDTNMIHQPNPRRQRYPVSTHADPNKGSLCANEASAFGSSPHLENANFRFNTQTRTNQAGSIGIFLNQKFQLSFEG